MHTTAFREIWFPIHWLNLPPSWPRENAELIRCQGTPLSTEKWWYQETVLPVGNSLFFHFGILEFLPVMHLSSDTKEQTNCSSIPRISVVGGGGECVWCWSGLIYGKDPKISLERQIFPGALNWHFTKTDCPKLLWG